MCRSARAALLTLPPYSLPPPPPPPCLNRKLREQADRVNPSMPAAPLDASSPDLKVGTVNIPAVQQQYGKNFGVSVMPYRPPPPIYNVPMGRH